MCCLRARRGSVALGPRCQWDRGTSRIALASLLQVRATEYALIHVATPEDVGFSVAIA